MVDLAFNAIKLSKVSNGESENEKSIMGNLLITDEGILPEPASILNWCRNLSLFPEVTFPDICNCLAKKTNKYSMENLIYVKSPMGHTCRLFKDGHVINLTVHKLPNMSATFVKYQVQPSER